MTPARVEHPRDVDELSAAVKRAAADGLTVKAIGSGHSFTGIGLTDGVLLVLDRYDRILSADAATGLVTVQAGLTLHRLNVQLASLGLGLTNMGDVDVQTVSGALSTGTHGTGRDSASLAAQVVALELVLADGSVVSCSRTERPDLFAAARVGLGALGILSTVTWQAEPAFLLHAAEAPLPVDEVLDGFDAFVADNEHAEFYWFPHTDIALTKRNNRSAGPVSPVNKVRSFLEDEVLGNGAFALINKVGQVAPRTIPRLNRFAAGTMAARTYTTAAHAVFVSPRRVRFVEMEYAVPRAALLGLFAELRTLPERHGLRISFPVEVRVAPPDDAWLSTAYDRESAYVAVHVVRGTPYEEYFAAVERLFDAVGGRPHWGKVHTLGVDQLRERCPRLDDFRALRGELDPEGRFSNAYLDRVLGPVGA